MNANNIDNVLERIGNVAERHKAPTNPPSTPAAVTETKTISASPAPAAAAAPAPAPAAPAVAKVAGQPAAKAASQTTAKAQKASAPAVAKGRPGRKPKAVSVEQTAPSTPAPSTPAPAPTATAAPVAATAVQAKRGRKPKVVAPPPSVSEAVKPSTTTQATSEATPAAPRKRGRPKKERPEAAQTSLFTQSASEDSGELSDDPKAPNYRFRNLLTNGKAKTFEGMKISEAINGEEVICLICGVHQNMIKKHLRARHNMSGEQYLTHFGIDPADEKSKDYLRGPGFGNRKSDETKASGFGKHERPAKAAVVEQPKTKARAKKATPTPATEMKKTRGRAKATA